MATEDVIHPVEELRKHSGLLLSFNVGGKHKNTSSRNPSGNTKKDPSKEDAYDAILHAFKKAKEKADEKKVKVDAILLQEYKWKGEDKDHGLDALEDKLQEESGGDTWEYYRQLQGEDTVLIINTTVLAIEQEIDDVVLKEASGYPKQLEFQRPGAIHRNVRKIYKPNPKQQKWEEQVDVYKNRWTASLLKVQNNSSLQFILLSYHQEKKLKETKKQTKKKQPEKKIAESAKVFVTEVLTKLTGAKKVPVLIGADWNVNENYLRRSILDFKIKTWTFNTSGVKTLKLRDLDIDFYLAINGSDFRTKVKMEHHETLEHRETHFEGDIFDHDAVVVQYTLGNSQAEVEERPIEFVGFSYK
jgi:DNA-binding protein Fis